MPGTSKKISDLNAIATMHDTDLVEVSNDNQDSTYTSVKATIGDVADHIANEVEFTNDLDTTDKTLVGAINEVAGDIPTVNDATLTIQKNSTTIDTFSANASSNVTVDISVPTTVAELSDASDYATTASLAAVATSGDYDDLLNKPTIPAAQVNSDWNSGSGVSQILNKPTLAAVATSGAYSDLSGTPALATVATSGAYSDLSGTPTLATVATSGSYNDLSSKPNIPDGLADLTDDVNITSPTDGQVLKYDNATSKWVNGTGGGGGASSLNDLSDVTITSPTAGQVLYFDGSKWINHEGGGSGGGSAQIDTLYSGTAVIGDVVPLSSAYTDYDMLMFKCYNTNMGGYFGSSWNVGSISINDDMLVGYATAGADRRLIGAFASSTTFSVALSENGTQLKEIVGYKFGGGSNSVELTYAEYQALTPEQQLDGTEYFITDINGDGQQFQPICYSETEREIGVWTDGKPLYEKTLVVSSLVSGSYQSVSHGITNPDTIFVKDGFALYTPSGVSYIASAILSVYSTSLQAEQFVGSVSRENFGYRCGNDVNGGVGYVTICYTKTTDTAGGGTWTPQGVPTHHYSNDEQIVGTWIDGNTLYEKTITFTAPSSNAYTTQTLGVTVDYVSIIESVAVKGSQVATLCGAYNGNPVNDEWEGFINLTNSTFDYRVGSSYYGADCYVTIRYTKPST